MPAVGARLALIRALIPLGLEAVHETLTAKVERRAGPWDRRAGGQPGLVGWSRREGSVSLAEQQVPITYQASPSHRRPPTTRLFLLRSAAATEASHSSAPGPAQGIDRALTDAFGAEALPRRALATQPSYTLDCDSTVATVYGEQEGARPGPNPHTRGRPSYHPLLCRERASGLVVNSRLRPGDTGTATDAVAFLRQSVARLPHARRRRVLVRADRGFDAEALYAACEQRGWHYVVKLRVTADLGPARSGSTPRRGAGAGWRGMTPKSSRWRSAASSASAGAGPGGSS